MSTTTPKSVQCKSTTSGWGLTQVRARVVARSTDPGNWQLSSRTAPGGDNAQWLFCWSGEINTPNAPLVLTLADTNVVLRELTDEASASQLWTLEDAEVDPRFVTPALVEARIDSNVRYEQDATTDFSVSDPKCGAAAFLVGYILARTGPHRSSSSSGRRCVC